MFDLTEYYSLSVVSEKLHFLENSPVHQKLWSFKCTLLKTLNSNFHSLSVLSEKRYFLENSPVHQKLWSFKCTLLKTLNSNLFSFVVRAVCKTLFS